MDCNLSMIVSLSSLWQHSCAALKNNWSKAVLAYLIFAMISMAAGFVPGVGSFAGILLYPLTAGYALFCLRLIRQQNPDTDLIFEPFKDYGRMLWCGLRVTIFVLLWSLLFIIPGIIASYRYTLTCYIVLDDENISIKEAMQKSCRLMKGHKLQLFGYSILFGFINCAALILTLGIALIWLIPFFSTFMANFYQAIKNQTEAPYTAGQITE